MQATNTKGSLSWGMTNENTENLKGRQRSRIAKFRPDIMGRCPNNLIFFFSFQGDLFNGSYFGRG